MSLADELAARAAESIRRERPHHPKGVEPGVTWTDATGRGIAAVVTAERDPDWTIVLERANLDPTTIEVVPGTVQIRTWDAAIGDGLVQTMRYYRAEVRRKREYQPDVALLLRHVKRQRTPGPQRTDSPVRAFHVDLNDWQIGKEGTEASVERIRDGYADAEAYLRRLRQERPVDAIYLDCIGDLHEGCRDHYPSQTYSVELDNRDQGIVVRKLVLEGIDRFRRLGPVVVPAVGGNHGEERSDGKAYTGPSDNRDVASVEQVAEICAANPSVYGNVSFMLPREELTLTFDAAGTVVGLAHGHKIKGSGVDATKGILDWWKGQMYGRRPVGDADLLVTAHRHKFSILQDGARTLMIAPTVDSGSRWWAETNGVDSRPAMLTFTTSGGGWDDVKLL